MPDVRVPDVKVTIYIEGEEVARFGFSRTSRSPEDWDIQAALAYADSRQAVRACLLACVSELAGSNWEAYTFVPENGGSTDDQLQLPWS